MLSVAAASITANAIDRHLSSKTEVVIDLSHSGRAGAAFGRNSTNTMRYQTFVARQGNLLKSVTLKLRKAGGVGHSDVTVKLYETAYQRPARVSSRPLASAVVPAALINSSWTTTTVPISFGNLQAGKLYSIVLSQVTLNDRAYYEWCTGYLPKGDLNSGTSDLVTRDREPRWSNDGEGGLGWSKINTIKKTLSAAKSTRKIQRPVHMVRDGRQLILSDSEVTGDYILTAHLELRGAKELRIFFASDRTRKNRSYYTIRPQNLSLNRTTRGYETYLREEAYRPSPGPWTVKLMKRGIYYFLNIDNQKDWVTWAAHPSGDVYYSVPGKFFWNSYSAIEPASGYVGFEAVDGNLTGRQIKFESIASAFESATLPVVSYSDVKGSWNESQCFPGAVLEVSNGKAYRDSKGYYYMYVNGSDTKADDQESGGAIRIGVVKSRNLINWDWGNGGKFVLEADSGAWDGISVFANGALVLREGNSKRFVIQYAGYGQTAKNLGWGGQGYAYADDPEGPFTKDVKNPVIPASVAMHEGHLTRVDDTYYYFRTVFTSGDKIFYSTSKDLYQWNHKANPIFVGSPGAWDGEHVRARSVVRVGKTWYLVYEGANRDSGRETGMPERWWDSIGLAKSTDLVHWTRFSLNPFIPGQPEDRIDTIWTGWPRMIVEGEYAYIYYSAGGYDFLKPRHHASTALIKIPLNVLKALK